MIFFMHNCKNLNKVLADTNNISLYGEEFPNLKYPLPLTFWSNLST